MILGIETSGEMAGVALVDGERIVREGAFPSQMAVCQRLVPRIEALLRSDAEGASARPRDLQAIAVSLGPGSFTSLRIGVATAKALAHAWEVDLVGVPTAHAIANGLADVPDGAVVCALTVARRDHVYIALVERSSDGAWSDVQQYEVHTVEALPDVLAARKETIVLCGEAAEEHVERLQERMGSQLHLAPDTELRPTARHVGFVGMAELERRGPDDLFSLTPIYAQTSQAEAARGIDLGL
jgi:tRNA threonylcarbamoyladenosine biosynthesis protein TsaB